MQEINLRDYYPFEEDSTIEVSDEIMAVLEESERQERNYTERVRWNKAYYSLHEDDGAIENNALFLAPSAEALTLCKWTEEELYKALDSLPDTQRQRIYAHFILGISKTEIAQTEGVRESAIRGSIERGLRQMKKFF